MGRGRRIFKQLLFTSFLIGIGCALLSASCKGGGGSDNSSVSCTDMTFTAADAAPADGDIFLASGLNSCTTLEVRVVVRNLSGIFTAAFDLTYPAGVVQYQSYTAGPLLTKGSPSVPPFFNVTPITGGVQVSMTRFAPDPSVSAVGSELLLTLRFNKVAFGSGMIDFNTGPGSLISEEILDENGSTRPASFVPGQGGLVMVP
jgi:hypothetical protein